VGARRPQDGDPRRVRHYFDRIPLRAVSNALQRDGGKYRVAVYGSPAAAGAPVFPNVLPEFPAGLARHLTIDPVPNSYGQQTNLQVERELPWSSSISANYVHLRGIHIIMSRNINLPVSNRPNPDFANISQYFGGGDSYYDGMTISANHRSGLDEFSAVLRCRRRPTTRKTRFSIRP
jgi:hypothetical protein